MSDGGETLDASEMEVIAKRCEAATPGPWRAMVEEREAVLCKRPLDRFWPPTADVRAIVTLLFSRHDTP